MHYFYTTVVLAIIDFGNVKFNELERARGQMKRIAMIVYFPWTGEPLPWMMSSWSPNLAKFDIAKATYYNFLVILSCFPI